MEIHSHVYRAITFIENFEVFEFKFSKINKITNNDSRTITYMQNY